MRLTRSLSEAASSVGISNYRTSCYRKILIRGNGTIYERDFEIVNSFQNSWIEAWTRLFDLEVFYDFFIGEFWTNIVPSRIEVINPKNTCTIKIQRRWNDCERYCVSNARKQNAVTRCYSQVLVDARNDPAVASISCIMDAIA